MLLADKRALFIHNMRTGGTSIEQMVYAYKLSFDVRFPRPHAPIEFWVQRYPDIGEQIATSYFKFAFVRNTWERLASAYRLVYHMLSSGMYAEVYSYRHTAETFTWDEFMRMTMEDGTVPYCAYWTDQLALMRYDSRVVADFIGSYDSYERDWYRVSRMLRWRLYRPMRCTLGAPTPHPVRYTDEQVEWVRGRYREEIDMFKFEYRP